MLLLFLATYIINLLTVSRNITRACTEFTSFIIATTSFGDFVVATDFMALKAIVDFRKYGDLPFKLP